MDFDHKQVAREGGRGGGHLVQTSRLSVCAALLCPDSQLAVLTSPGLGHDLGHDLGLDLSPDLILDLGPDHFPNCGVFRSKQGVRSTAVVLFAVILAPS